MVSNSYIGQYSIISKINTGTTCVVKRCLDVDTLQTFAMKIFKSKSVLSRLKPQFQNELAALRRLDSSKIVRIENAGEDATYTKKNNRGTYPCMYICTELAPLGTLHDFIIASGPLSEDLARVYFTDLVKALEQVHAAGIVHHDVRLENILLDYNFKMVLCDFGSAQATDPNDDTFKPLDFQGSPWKPSPYMAPEVVAASPFPLDNPTAADVFSAGVVLFTMVFRCPPFRQASFSDSHYRLFVAQNDEFWNLFKTPTISKGLKDTINCLLEHDASMRATLDQVRNLPWYSNRVLARREALEAIRKMHRPSNHPATLAIERKNRFAIIK